MSIPSGRQSRTTGRQTLAPSAPVTTTTPTRTHATGEYVRSPAYSMTLLTEVMDSPLDPSYAEAAAKRAEAQRAANASQPGGPQPDAVATSAWRTALRRHSVASWVLLGAVAVALGIGTVTAAEALRVPQPVMRETRALLEGEVADRNADIAELIIQADSLTAEIAELQAAALPAQDAELAALIQIDTLNNGSAPVVGPGLEITLTDGGGALADANANPEAQVRDADVQRVVAYLWQSGAEAIAVDDQRLTMTSAIRNAGSAILVDLIPLSGPTYTVRAIGSPAQLLAGWERSGGPAYLVLLGNQYGIRTSVTPQGELALPGATSQTLRYAKPITSDS